MEATLDLAKLYTELRKSSKELQNRLNVNTGSPTLQSLIMEEIQDVENAIQKITLGNYGKCEISGEQIPFDFLKVMPTIKTMEDIDGLHHFYRKPITYNVSL
ncbi:hypothetical protein [Bacillus sp. T3]|uniref:hypothetical protein n=1 Tax=Bacillus sp. T3 TaxID=467262 RepID=UPI002980CF60|nr:hypothetical protein [Bacillus sp. T3]